MHRFEQSAGKLDSPDLLTFGFDPDGLVRIEPAKLVHEDRVEPFLAWLGDTRNVADERAAVLRQAFEIEDLGAGCFQRRKKPRLAAAGRPAEDVIAELGRQRVELVAYPRAICLPAAGEAIDLEAD